MDTVDFIVIGAGIAGASAAYRLAEHGTVVVLERESIAGYHTTGRSAAVFTEAYESDEVRALTRGSRAFFEDPPDGFSDVRLLSPMPVLLLARPDQMDTLDEEFDRSDGLVQRLDRMMTRARCPVLRQEYVGGALLEKHACSIDVHALHQGFLRGVRQKGGRVVTNAEVLTLERSGSWTVSTSAGSFVAPTVVNAAGAWADDVARMAGIRPLGLVPMRRTAFTFDPHQDTAGWPMVIDIDEAFYFKPDGHLLLASPCDETPMEPCDVRHQELDVAIAIDRLHTATSLEIRHVTTAWAGLRTFAPDRLPIVGWGPDTPGFFWLAGQGGFGIMTSPALSQVAVALIAGCDLPVDLHRLAPGRFIQNA